MIKRMICLILSIVLLVMLNGCSKPVITDDDLPTLKLLVIGGSSQDALARISTAISQITIERIGCRVSLQQVSLSEYEETITYKRFNGDFPDLFVSSSASMLSRLVSGGWVLPLDQSLQNYPDLQNAVSDEYFWKTVLVNGQTYAIPFGNSGVYSFGFIMRADICNELGIDSGSVRNLEQLHDVLIKVSQHYPDMDLIVPSFNILAPNIIWDPVGDGIGVIMYRNPIQPAIELAVGTPEFQEWCRTMRRWNLEGLIMDNVSFNKEPRTGILSSGRAFGGFARIDSQTLANLEFASGYAMTYARLSENRLDFSENNLSMCVFSKSEYPDLAMDFVNLLYTDKELLELCIYGEQDIDHAVSDRQTIVNLENSPLSFDAKYVITNWCWPLRESVRLLDGSYLEDDSLKLNPRVSPALGFSFDDRKVMSSLNNCQTILNKYYPALLSGQLDPDIALPMLLEELQIAGINEIIAEKQSQLDIWLEKQQK